MRTGAEKCALHIKVHIIVLLVKKHGSKFFPQICANFWH